MKVTLLIDTSNNKKTVVQIKKGTELFEEILEVEKPRSDITLNLIEKVLQKSQTTLHQITHMYVEKGPGSYTGLRIGISIANTLGFSLGIPVNDKSVGEIEEPKY